MKWWVVSVMLRRWSGWTSALQAARDLYATNNPKLVDRRGFAPRSSACKAEDLLNDRAAQVNWSRGRESNPRVDGL
jgi:hypothetical protein